MQNRLATVLIDINKLLSELIDLYKIEFIQDYQILNSHVKFIASNFEAIPGIDLFFEALQKIVYHYKKDGIAMMNLQQNFIKDYQQIYSENQTNINIYLSAVYNLLKKYWLQILNFIDLEDNKKNRLTFYLNNLLSAIDPKNFLMFNQELINATLYSAGKNLLYSIEKLLIDLIANKGYFVIKNNDLSAFKVGENLGATLGKIVFKNDLIELIRYTPATKKVNAIPILFIPPFINKYYVLDLSENNSLVKWLVEQGMIVYMISWFNPKNNSKEKKFSDYIINGSLKAIDVITKKSKVNKVHLAGYCVGGTLISCTLAYKQKLKDHRVLSARYFMSLVDFSNLGNIGALINESSLSLLEKFINKKGYLDGRLLNLVFNSLRPAELIWPYIINHYLLHKPLEKSDFLYWNSDVTNLPANMYIFYLKLICHQNKLTIPNAIKINKIGIDLSKIKTPTFCLAGNTDHITLWQSVYNGAKLYGSKIEFVLSSAGHIKGIINPPKDNKYSFKTNTQNNKLIKKLTPEEWLKNSKNHKGSWWPYWIKWLKSFNKKTLYVKNLNCKLFDLPNAPDAPGSYVVE